MTCILEDIKYKKLLQCIIKLDQRIIFEEQTLFDEDENTLLTSLAKVNDTQIAVRGDNSYSIKIWDLIKGKIIKTIITNNKNYCLIKVDEKHIASGGFDNTIIVYELQTGKCIKTFTGHSNSINHLAKLNSNHIASWSNDLSIKIWNLTSGNCLKTLFGLHILTNSFVRLNDTLIATGGCNRLIQIWNLQTNKCLKISQDYSTFSLLRLNHSLMAGGVNSSIEIWDYNTGKSIKTLKGHIESVIKLIKISEIKIVSGSMDKSIKIWNFQKGNCIKTLKGDGNPVLDMERLNKAQIVSLGRENNLRIWNI